jgi:type VI secretion system protein ImpK
VSDNPFAEPEDSDRTIVRPVPGGRRPPAPPPAAPAYEPPPPRAEPAAYAPPEAVSAVATGDNPLTIAAAPLLQLLARLRNAAHTPDPGDLRERAVRAVQAFEKQARESGLPMELLRPAHYALCASIDDVVMNTPWGGTGTWEARSLVSTFHQEVRAGDRFFDILAQVRQHPGTFLPVLELMYLCLSLGFMGRYRLTPRGPGAIDQLREEVYALIVRARARPAQPELSPRWKGVSAPYRPRRGTIPIWAAAAVALVAVLGAFVWTDVGLNTKSDDLYARMITVPPDHMPAIQRAAVVQPVPPAPPPEEPTTIDKLRTFLKPEIDQGLVAVLGTPSTPIVRILNKGMFLSGSAVVQPQFIGLLERIGTALKDEKGPVQIIGYTDNQPIRTVRFPSNFQLSAARAQAAQEIVGHTIDDKSRITSEGRGEADPIASNATPEGRDQNRRIEVILHRTGGSDARNLKRPDVS